jgi:hypothetical protein
MSILSCRATTVHIFVTRLALQITGFGLRAEYKNLRVRATAPWRDLWIFHIHKSAQMSTGNTSADL